MPSNIKIPPSGVWLIEGANGSGKSSLFQSWLGLLPLDAPYVPKQALRALQKKAEEFLLPWPLKPRSYSCLFQNEQIFTDCTVEERLLILGNDLHIKEHFIFEMFQVFLLWDKKISALSGGERQRVFLAGVLAAEKPIVILDEPMNHLDKNYREKLEHWIEKDRSKRLWVVTSHALLSIKPDWILTLTDKEQELTNVGCAKLCARGTNKTLGRRPDLSVAKGTR